MKFKILHIAVHMGGGLGTVLWNWVKTDDENTHRVLCLNRNYYRDYDDKIVFTNMRNRPEEIIEQMKLADVVVVHFWNHPMMYEFLLREDLPSCRMCIWAHVSGLKPPYVFPEKLLDMADRFVFASPISYQDKEVAHYYDPEKFKHVWTTGDIHDYFNVKRYPTGNFNIGFVGTLDYSKVYPRFIELCRKIDLPKVHFIIVGEGCDGWRMKQETIDLGIEDRFTFTGVLQDIKPYLGCMDLFGYPLNPDHFGTCEQVLGEAIASGIVPVCLNNPAEQYILRRTPWLASKDEDAYVHNMEVLYHNHRKRQEMLGVLQDFVRELYNSKTMVNKWHHIITEIMEKEKSPKKWFLQDNSARVIGSQIFIESVGRYGDIFRRNNYEEIQKLFNSNLQWKSDSKGSPKQYLNSFPGDKYLLNLVRLIEQGE